MSSRRRPLLSTITAIAVSGALVLAACGGDDDASKSAASPAPQAEQSQSAAPETAPDAAAPAVAPEAPMSGSGAVVAEAPAAAPAPAPKAAAAAPAPAAKKATGAAAPAPAAAPGQAAPAAKAPAAAAASAPAAPAPTPAPAGGNGGATDVGVTADSIKFGGIYALGYPLSDVLFQPMIRQQQAANKIVNDTGGIHGRKLTYITCDDGFPDAARTRACYKKLVEQDKIFAFINGCTWNEDQFQADMQKDKVPYFAPCSLYSVEWRNPYSFPVHMDMRQEALAGAAWVIKNKKPKTYGVLCKVDMPDSMAACNNVEKGMAASGAKRVYKGEFRTGTPDMSGDILAARAANPDILIDFVIDPSITARFMIDASQQDYWPPMGYTANHKTTEILGGLIGDYPAKKGFWAQTSYLLWGGEFIAWSLKYVPNNKGMNHHLTQGEYLGSNSTFECMRRIGPNLTRVALMDCLNSQMWEAGAGLGQRVMWAAGQRYQPDTLNTKEHMYKYMNTHTFARDDGTGESDAWVPDKDQFIMQAPAVEPTD